MRAHWKYLLYLIRHKWFVFLACRFIGGVSLWRSIIHDWSKFTPLEWRAYVNYFYVDHPSLKVISSGLKAAGYPYELTREYWDQQFCRAWLAHQHRNKHHWQHWILKQDDGQVIVLPMPEKYLREMVADWMGAGRAITGDWDYRAWYKNNRTKIILHHHTQEEVERIMGFCSLRKDAQRRQ